MKTISYWHRGRKTQKKMRIQIPLDKLICIPFAFKADTLGKRFLKSRKINWILSKHQVQKYILNKILKLPHFCKSPTCTVLLKLQGNVFSQPLEEGQLFLTALTLIPGLLKRRVHTMHDPAETPLGWIPVLHREKTDGYVWLSSTYLHVDECNLKNAHRMLPRPVWIMVDPFC